MNQKHHSLVKLIGMLLVVMGVSLWLGTSNRMEVQAASIPQPTTIDQLFPDTALAEVMREALGKTSVTDTVSQSELDQVTFVPQPVQTTIQSLEGLQYVNNLTNLYLNGNQISDVSPLAALNNLTQLDLSNNQISDVSPLAALNNLTYLCLYNNQISDVSPLAGLNNLTYLNLYNNQISDVSPLAALNKLTYLCLDSNQISDVSPLAALNKLTDLRLESNQISDVSPLAALNKLTDLRLESNQISDVSPLAALNKLTTLNLADQQINQESIPYQPNLVLPNVVKDGTGSWIAPATISNNGTYTSPNISWNLPNYLNEVGYTFSQTITIGGSTTIFNGTVTQPLEQAPLLFTVMYEVDGTQTSTSVEAGTLLAEPTAPTKEGYTFTGWYDAKTGGNPWDFTTDTMPANDLTLYAQFSVNSYELTFDIDGATTTEVDDYHTLLTEPTAPTKEGYTFTGWYDAKTGGNPWDFTTDTMPANDLTLYAQFTKQTVPDDDKGTPDQGGGTNTDAPSDTGSTTSPGEAHSPITISQDGQVTNLSASGGEDSNTTNIGLPKTGDETKALPLLLGMLCLGLATFLGFRRTRTK